MNGNNVSDILGGAFIFLLMIFYWYSLGIYMFRSYAYTIKGRTATYQAWGVQIEPFAPTTITRSTLYLVGLFAGALFNSWLAFFAATILVDSGRFELTFVFAFMSLVIGYTRERERIKAIETKIREITNLRSVFFEVYSRADLISLYESLRHAPRLFWEEYASLPDDRINESTNSKYREIAAPFHQNWARRTTVILIIVAVVGLVVSGAVAVRDWSS